MFMHIFKYTFKILSRQRTLLFWALIFPIILGALFKLALGNIMTAEQFEAIPVAVNEKLMQNISFNSFIKSMEQEGYFYVHKSADKKILVENKNIIAYIESENEIYTSKSGIKETIVENIMNAYVQKKSTINNILKRNPFTNISKLINTKNYIKDISYKNMDPINAVFYTLVGMQTMYGYMWGLYVIYQYEANLSTEAKKNLIAPVSKKYSFLSAISVAWLFNLCITLVFIIYLKFILNVDFGGQLPPIIGLVVLSSLTGVAFGSLIGVSNKAALDVKIGCGIAITMLCSFLAGMMNAQMRVIIQAHIPIINKINPVSLITDAMYALYYYSSMQRFVENIIYLGIVTLVFIAGTVFCMRSKQYESL